MKYKFIDEIKSDVLFEATGYAQIDTQNAMWNARFHGTMLI